MLIVESHNLDVYWNLAMEEYLMDEARDRGPILFLWRGGEAVVMGKNQNPWMECRLDLMEKEGVPLARRVSGGGTVYHDEGNLNYCVITGREEYQEQRAYELVFNALERFGIRAEKTGKSNLSVDGLKFSGNAFAFRKGRAMHHGTLLLNADLVKLNRYLGSMFDGIDTRAIRSCPADVTNLNLDGEDVSRSLKAAFAKLYKGSVAFEWRGEEVPESLFAPILERQRSEKWTYSSTPRFSLQLGEERVDVEKGVVVSGVHAGTPFRKLAFSCIC